jgi:nicotinamidase-related amidase
MSLVPESFRADPAHSAVLLVDLQVDFLRDEGRLPVPESFVPPLLECAEAVVTEALKHLLDDGIQLYPLQNGCYRAR